MADHQPLFRPFSVWCGEPETSAPAGGKSFQSGVVGWGWAATERSGDGLGAACEPGMSAPEEGSSLRRNTGYGFQYLWPIHDRPRIATGGSSGLSRLPCHCREVSGPS
uniref:Uncharacterized protein n=1 Tax=Mycena chlorophos TaxID=658473 RepID=A0ABQ0LKC6_MYCCL|nr:predicted protein [Mycena chlorophos]